MGALIIAKYIKVTDHFPMPTNPLAMWAALKLAIVLGVMLVATSLAQRLFGNVGTQVVAFLGGLVEIHGVALALANMYQHQQITQEQAINGIGLSVFASIIAKYFIAASIVRNKYTLWVSLMLTVMLIVYSIFWILII
jgi:uncharacterized membrane protein (DUF4010 family)